MTNGSCITDGIKFIPYFHTTVVLLDRDILKRILGSLLSTAPALRQLMYAVTNLTA